MNSTVNQLAADFILDLTIPVLEKEDEGERAGSDFRAILYFDYLQCDLASVLDKRFGFTIK